MHRFSLGVIATAAMVLRALAAPAGAQSLAVSTADPTRAIASAHSGFWTVTRGGQVTAFEGARYYGSITPPSHVIVAMGAGFGGYWLAGADGSVVPKGAPPDYGHSATITRRIVSIAVTSARHGY